MKTTLVALSLSLLALWIGYSLGYHCGAQSERQAWESSVLRSASTITLNNESAQLSQPALYKNPHAGGVIMHSQGHNQMPVNGPSLKTEPERRKVADPALP